MKRQIVFLHDQQDRVITMVPQTFASIIATTPEAFLDKVTQYGPDVVIILPTLLNEQPWELLGKIEHVEYVIIRATTEKEYHFFSELQNWFSNLSVIPPLLSEEEVKIFLQHIEKGDYLEDVKVVEPKARAFIGSGGTGITTFFLLAAPWYAQQHPNKDILLVDMNEDKRDLSVALSAQPAQLSLWQAYLARGNDRFVPFAVRHPRVKNLSILSAVKPWASQDLSTFLSVARRDYHEIWFDVSRPFHVMRLLDEVDDIIYVVRPDGLCLSGMKRIVRTEWEHKAKLLLTQADERFASASEIASYLNVKSLMGNIPFEHPLLPLDVSSEMSLSKRMKKALEKLNWGIKSEQEKASLLHRWAMGWKK